MCRSHFCSGSAEVGGNTIPRLLLHFKKIEFLTALPGAVAALAPNLSYIYNAPLGAGAFRKHPDHYITDYYSQKAAQQTKEATGMSYLREYTAHQKKYGRGARFVAAGHIPPPKLKDLKHGPRRAKQLAWERHQRFRKKQDATLQKSTLAGFGLEDKWYTLR